MPNKYANYRARCVAAGLCPHCGKPCAPYRECEDRRLAKRVAHLRSRMKKLGITDVEDLPLKSSGDDRRTWPRLAGQPIEEAKLIRLAMRYAGSTASWVDVAKMIAKLRADFKN